MAVYKRDFNYDEREFIKILNNEDNRVAQIEELLDTDNHVQIMDMNVISIEQSNEKTVILTVSKEHLKCKLTVIDDYTEEPKTYEDCYKMSVKTIDNLFENNDYCRVFINDREIFKIAETDSTYTFHFCINQK